MKHGLRPLCKLLPFLAQNEVKYIKRFYEIFHDIVNNKSKTGLVKMTNFLAQA